ncbi:MAG: hypothetical protein PHP65_00950 [Bacilli bacterium]|nr:hypothetical protein [Bacilli bacterium]
MNTFKTTTKLDFRTLKYCNLFLIKYRRKAYIWFIITAVLSLGIAIYDIIVIKSQYYMFAILSILFVFYSLYQMLTVEKKLDTSLIRFFQNRPVSSQTIEIDSEKIIVARSLDTGNPTTYEWAFITEIDEMPQFYMLMVGKNAPIIIDRSSENVLEGSLETLDAIIKEKISAKPYKVVTKDIVKIPITYVHQEPIYEEPKEVVSEELTQQQLDNQPSQSEEENQEEHKD